MARKKQVYNNILKERPNVLQPNPTDPIAQKFDKLITRKQPPPKKNKVKKKSNIRKLKVGESLILSRSLNSYLDSLIDEKRIIVDLPDNVDDLASINESITYVRKVIKLIPNFRLSKS